VQSDPGVPGQEMAEPGEGTYSPGALSALLVELARAPGVAPDVSWEAWLRPGAVVGRFELVRELGRGGLGVVWEARDPLLGRSVAFKAVRAGAQLRQRSARSPSSVLPIPASAGATIPGDAPGACASRGTLSGSATEGRRPVDPPSSAGLAARLRRLGLTRHHSPAPPRDR
jgi:hypothetical protein